MLVQCNSEKNNKLEALSRNIGSLPAQYFIVPYYYLYVHINYNNK